MTLRNSIANFGTTRRLREIMSDAPWSNHDLLIGVIFSGIGLDLFFNPEALTMLRALEYLNERGSAKQWSLLFFAIGAINIAVTLWCIVPSFFIRLFARMIGAFGLLLIALSSCHFSPIVPSTIIYLTLAVWSVWGILRTHKSGR